MLRRIYQTIMINVIPSAHKRTKWMKKHRVFKQIGNNVSLASQQLWKEFNKCHDK